MHLDKHIDLKATDIHVHANQIKLWMDSSEPNVCCGCADTDIKRLVKMVVCTIFFIGLWLGLAGAAMLATNISFSLALAWVSAILFSITSFALIFYPAFSHERVGNRIVFLRFRKEPMALETYRSGTFMWLTSIASLLYIPSWVLLAYLINSNCGTSNGFPCYSNFSLNASAIVISIVISVLADIVVGFIVLFLIRFVMKMLDWLSQRLSLARVAPEMLPM